MMHDFELHMFFSFPKKRASQGPTVVQILFHSHFDLVSSLLALEATEPVSEPVTQMALELINNHLISVQQNTVGPR